MPLHLAAAGVLLAVLVRPVYDADMFWQLRTGDIVLESGALPEREPFLADRGDEPFSPVAWAGQTVYALLRRVGGWPLLHVADGLLWVGGFAFAAMLGRRLGASPWAAGIALALGGYSAFSSVSTRPQTLGLASFGLLIWLVGEGRPSWRTCLSAFALLVVWQNLHPSAAVGVFWLGALTVVANHRRLRRTGPTPWALALLTLASPWSLIATPAGFDIMQISSANADISLWLEINEWLPLWKLEVRGDHRTEACIGLSLFATVLIWRRRRLSAEQVLPALVIAAMALASYRFVLFWAAAAVPVFAIGFTRISSSTIRHRPFDWPTRFALIVAWVLPLFVSTVLNPSHLADYVPHRAVRELKEEVPTGTIYCDIVWAGVLVDEGSHEWRVSHDGRYYLRTKAEWLEYYAVARGETSIADLDRRWHPVAFVLRTGFEDGIIALLRRDRGWRELNGERDCVVFVRATSR